MAKYSNIPNGISIPSQVSLNPKERFATLSDLTNLGNNNVKAYTYYNNMLVFCAEDYSFYVWRERNSNDTDDSGILGEDFQYPPNYVSRGFNYSNALFNFFKQEFTNLDEVYEYINSTIPNGLLSPGYISWSGEGFTYNISTAKVRINEVHIIPFGQITLEPSHETFNRFDLPYVTVDGFGVKTGTPAANPVIPQLDDYLNQIPLVPILVEANTVEPSDVTIITIYKENIEWTASYIGLGTANFESLNPRTGDYAAEVSDNVSGGRFRFVSPIDVDLNEIDLALFWIDLKAVLAGNQNIDIYFRDVNSVQLTSAYNVTLNKNLVGEYQLVTVAISDLNFLGNGSLARRVEVRYTSNNSNPHLGYFIDDFVLQTGIEQPTSTVNQHNQTLGKQGGNEILDEYYHLPKEEYENVLELPPANTIETKDGATTKANTAEINANNYTDNQLQYYILLDEKAQPNGVATLDSNGKLLESQLPDLAITDSITSNEDSISAFIANNTSYIYQKGDVIIIDNSGAISHYLFKGGDKFVLANYSQINATNIPISAVIGLQAVLDNKEEILGNPTVNGQVLVSTIDGIRSWVDFPASELSIQDKNGVEQFTSDGYLQFEGFTFDPTNNRIISETELPLNVFLDPVNGNDVTAQVESPNKPFQTFDAMIAALPESQGEVYNINIITFSNLTNIPVNRRVPIRNLKFFAIKDVNLNFTNCMEDDGVTSAINCAVNLPTPQASTWQFEDERIGLVCTHVGRKELGSLSTLTFRGRLRAVDWKSVGSAGHQAVIQLADRNDLYIKDIYDTEQVRVLFRFNNNFPFRLHIGKVHLQYGRQLFRESNGYVRIDEVVQIGSSSITWNPPNVAPNIDLDIGNINFIGTFWPAVRSINFNGQVGSNCNVTFRDTKKVSGTLIGDLYHQTTTFAPILFDGFTGKIHNIRCYTVSIITIKDSFIETNTNLLTRENAHTIEECVIFQGFNTILQVNTSGDLLIGSESFPIKILIEGTLKTNSKTYGKFVSYENIASTFKEKENEQVIRSKWDIVNRPLSAQTAYIIDGDIAQGAGEYIKIPAGGLTLAGYGFDSSRLGSYGITNHSIFRNEPIDSLLDSHGANNGTVYYGVTSGHTSFLGKSFYFDGINDYIQLPTTATEYFPDNTKSFTFGGWFKITSLKASVIFGSTFNITGAGNASVLIEANGDLKSHIRGSLTTIASGLTINTWYYIEVKWDGVGGTAKAYFNGVESIVNVGSGANRASDTPRLARSVAGHIFNGYISSYFYFSKSKTLAESDISYNSGDGLSYAVEDKTGLVSFYEFNEPSTPAGNIVIHNIAFTTTGTNAKVFDVEDPSGTKALEMVTVNFEGCKSLGRLSGYRQGTGTTIGFYGCADGFILDGTWNGFKLTNTNAFGFGANGVLFKAGDNLTFNNRFYIDINIDFLDTSVICDFAPANFNDEKLLQVKNTMAKIGGVLDPVAATAQFFPNITPEDAEALFEGNVGLMNTTTQPYGIGTENLIVATDDADAALQGIEIGQTYIEDSTGYFKVRLV